MYKLSLNFSDIQCVSGSRISAKSSGWEITEFLQHSVADCSRLAVLPLHLFMVDYQHIVSYRQQNTAEENANFQFILNFVRKIWSFLSDYQSIQRKIINLSKNVLFWKTQNSLESVNSRAWKDAEVIRLICKQLLTVCCRNSATTHTLGVIEILRPLIHWPEEKFLP